MSIIEDAANLKLDERDSMREYVEKYQVPLEHHPFELDLPGPPRYLFKRPSKVYFIHASPEVTVECMRKLLTYKISAGTDRVLRKLRIIKVRDIPSSGGPLFSVFFEVAFKHYGTYFFNSANTYFGAEKDAAGKMHDMFHELSEKFNLTIEEEVVSAELSMSARAYLK